MCRAGKLFENFRTSSRKGNFNDPYPNAPWAPTSYQENYIENTGDFDMFPGMLKLWSAAPRGTGRRQRGAIFPTI